MKARKTVNDCITSDTLNIDEVVNILTGKTKIQKPCEKPLLDYFHERASIRKYGRAADSKERYDRFLRWFEQWGGMVTFNDLTEIKVAKMDEYLTAKGFKPYSIWNNYHRFLNSFILDAINDGIIQRNPYKHIHIDKDKTRKGISKYLTKEEFASLAKLDPTTNYLRHARDLFIFQTYTCLSYTDLESFDPTKIQTINGKPVYVGYRGKTKQEFTFLMLDPAMQILHEYGGELPIMSNQHYNDRLKILAVMAGINKPVSSHWARHTGATLLLNSGVPMEIVSRVLGHSSTKITREVYAKLLDETVVDEMARVADKL